MHVITQENYEEAVDATRDILLLYFDMAWDYEGFGHASDYGVRFDRLKFVDAEIDSKTGGVDLNLLRSGSAIAILCAFYDLWCEEQSLANHPITRRYEEALEAGRLSPFPDIEGVIREAIDRNDMALEDDWFDRAVVPIYRKYITGFFKQLAASDRSAHNSRVSLLGKLLGR